ncbi:MAG TPA: hypothetical protein VIH57_25835 [Bacteroidales bacterium]
MSGIAKYLPVLFIFSIFACRTVKKDNNSEDLKPTTDTLVSLENNNSQLTFSLWGGTLVKFQDKTLRINPFNWKQNKGSNDSLNNVPLQGQFLSLGRWMLPTPGERKLGMPLNGEPVNNWWKLDTRKNSEELTMSCEAPLDGYSISRDVILSQSDPLFKVNETFTNDFSIARTCAIVQNVILVPPFYDQSVVINSNAKWGFSEELISKNTDTHEYLWPNAFIDTLQISTIDLRKFSDRFKYTSSFIFPDSIGWATLYSPNLKLLLGYTWKTKEYPWFHVRNEIYYGKQVTHSISFGTTGLDDKFSFEDCVATTFHNVRNFDFIDAKSSLTKSWFCFLIKVPIGFKNVSKISFFDDQVAIAFDTYGGSKEIKLAL